MRLAIESFVRLKNGPLIPLLEASASVHCGSSRRQCGSSERDEGSVPSLLATECVQVASAHSTPGMSPARHGARGGSTLTPACVSAALTGSLPSACPALAGVMPGSIRPTEQQARHCKLWKSNLKMVRTVSRPLSHSRNLLFFKLTLPKTLTSVILNWDRFTISELHRPKVYCWMSFDSCNQWCNHHSSQDVELFRHLEKFPHSPSPVLRGSLSSDCRHRRVVLPVLELHVHGIIR